MLGVTQIRFNQITQNQPQPAYRLSNYALKKLGPTINTREMQRRGMPKRGRTATQAVDTVSSQRAVPTTKEAMATIRLAANCR